MLILQNSNKAHKSASKIGNKKRLWLKKKTILKQKYKNTERNEHYLSSQAKKYLLKILERMLEKSIQKGKLFIFAIIVSSIVFLVLHNNDLYFQEYGNRIFLKVIRIAIFAPLLYLLYKKHNWARYTLAVISSILVIAGIIGFLLFLKDWMKPPDILYLGAMMVCMIFRT